MTDLENLAQVVARKIVVRRVHRPDGTIHCTALKWPGFHFILAHGERDDAMRATLAEFLILYAKAEAIEQHAKGEGE